MGLFKLIASGGNPITYAGLTAAEGLMNGKKKQAPETTASWSGPGPSPLMMIGMAAGGAVVVGVVMAGGALLAPLLGAAALPLVATVVGGGLAAGGIAHLRKEEAKGDAIQNARTLETAQKNIISSEIRVARLSKQLDAQLKPGAEQSPEMTQELREELERAQAGLNRILDRHNFDKDASQARIADLMSPSAAFNKYAAPSDVTFAPQAAPAVTPQTPKAPAM